MMMRSVGRMPDRMTFFEVLTVTRSLHPRDGTDQTTPPGTNSESVSP